MMRGSVRKTIAAAGVLVAVAGALVVALVIAGTDRGPDADSVPDLVKLRAQAEEGDAMAQAHLAGLYLDGFKVEQDYAEAARWYQAAAEQGQAIAQWRLGGLYRDGEGVARDYSVAYAWLTVAAVDPAPIGVGLGAVPAAERDELAGRMSAEQIAAGQRLARELWQRIEGRELPSTGG